LLNAHQGEHRNFVKIDRNAVGIKCVGELKGLVVSLGQVELS